MAEDTQNTEKTPVFQSKVNRRAGSWWEMLKMTYEDWSEDKAPGWAPHWPITRCFRSLPC